MGKPVRLFKVLRADLRPPIQSEKAPYVPGVWTRHVPRDKIWLCVRGYHYCQGGEVAEWLSPWSEVVAEIEVCSKHEQWPEWRHAGVKAVTCSLRIVRYWRLTREDKQALFANTAKGDFPASRIVYKRLRGILDTLKPDWEMEAGK